MAGYRNLTRVLDQLLTGVRGKGAGVFGDALDGDAGGERGILRLSDKAWSGDHDRRKAENFRRDAGAGFLRRAESAAAIAGNDRVDLELLESALEFVFLRTDRAGTRIGAGRSDFAQEIDLGRRELFENEPFEFGMGDGRHEAASNEGDCLSVEGFEPRRLNDRLNGARRERHEYGRLCCLAVLFGKGTDPVCAFRGCRAGYREQEKSDRKRQCSLDCQHREGPLRDKNAIPW